MVFERNQSNEVAPAQLSRQCSDNLPILENLGELDHAASSFRQSYGRIPSPIMRPLTSLAGLPAGTGRSPEPKGALRREPGGRQTFSPGREPWGQAPPPLRSPAGAADSLPGDVSLFYGSIKLSDGNPFIRPTNPFG